MAGLWAVWPLRPTRTSLSIWSKSRIQKSLSLWNHGRKRVRLKKKRSVWLAQSGFGLMDADDNHDGVTADDGDMKAVPQEPDKPPAPRRPVSSWTLGLSPPKKKSRGDKTQDSAAGAADDGKTSSVEGLLGPGGCQLVDAGGGGECGFRSLALALAQKNKRTIDETKPKLPALGDTHRWKCANYLKEHDEWKQTWLPDKEATAEREDGPVPQNAGELCEAFYRKKRWICGLGIEAAAKVCNCDVLVWEKNAQDQWEAVFSDAGCGRTEARHFATSLGERTVALRHSGQACGHPCLFVSAG